MMKKKRPDKPILLTEMFRKTGIRTELVYEDKNYVVLKIYLHGHNLDWYKTMVEIPKSRIKGVGE